MIIIIGIAIKLSLLIFFDFRCNNSLPRMKNVAMKIKKEGRSMAKIKEVENS